MADLTSQQQTEFAALRRALSEGDLDMVAACFDILAGLDTPLLPLLDTLGQGIWDDDDEGAELEGLIVQILGSMEEDAIAPLATFLMEEEGPDLLLDLVAERLQEFSESELLPALRKGLRNPDERIREGVRDYLDEMAGDSPAAEALLDEFEAYE
jgi:hypothetical protein